VIEKEIAERAFVFVEYVGSFPASGGNSQLFNSGVGYRIIRSTFTSGSASITMRRPISSASAIRSGSTASSDVWSSKWSLAWNKGYSNKGLFLDHLQACVDRPR
jgi:hypothetical protein